MSEKKRKSKEVKKFSRELFDLPPGKVIPKKKQYKRNREKKIIEKQED